MTLLQKLVYGLTIKPRMEKLQKLLPEAKIHPVGSRYVCSPPVMGTDIDFLVLVKSYDDAYAAVIDAGYIKTTDIDKYIDAGENFITWRCGVVNLIMSNDRVFVEGFHTAAHLCRKFNLRIKDERIQVHAAFRKNQYAPETLKMLKLSTEIQTLLESFNGAHGHAIHKAYRAKHGLEL
jgi:hypothetical protein